MAGQMRRPMPRSPVRWGKNGYRTTPAPGPTRTRRRSNRTCDRQKRLATPTTTRNYQSDKIRALRRQKHRVRTQHGPLNMVDWNAFFTFNRTKGILLTIFLIIGFLIPFTYQEKNCTIACIGFPAPMYTKTITSDCPTLPFSVRNFYQFNILAIIFNSILFYLLSCILCFIYNYYGKKH